MSMLCSRVLPLRGAPPQAASRDCPRPGKETFQKISKFFSGFAGATLSIAMLNWKEAQVGQVAAGPLAVWRR